MVNQAMRAKFAWKLCHNEDREWVKICKNKYLEESNSLLTLRNPPKGSSFWNGLVEMRNYIMVKSIWEANNGQIILIWYDKWLGSTSLVDYVKTKISIYIQEIDHL